MYVAVVIRELVNETWRALPRVTNLNKAERRVREIAMKSRLSMSMLIQGICLFMLAATACQATKAEFDKDVCSDFVRSEVYYGRPVEIRLAEVRRNPIEKQYAVFICGVQYMRPRAWEMAQPFASQGSVTAEFLVRKLPLIRGDNTIEDIVTLLGYMNARGDYKLKKDSDLERVLQLAVANMKDQVQQERVQHALGLLVP
jgi:hypothetical protein